MAVAVLPRHNLGLRGLHRLGLGDTSGNPGAGVQIVNGAGGQYIADANGNTVYTQAEVAANPGLLTQVTANSGCPSGSVPTWTMGGSVCQYPGAGATCEDPTGVCGSFAQPGQTQANPGNADAGWVLSSDGSGWFWNGPGQPTTPSPGAINELTYTAVPSFVTNPTAVPAPAQAPNIASNPVGSISSGGTAMPLTSNTTNVQAVSEYGAASNVIAPSSNNYGNSIIAAAPTVPQCPQITQVCGQGQQLSLDPNGCAVPPCIAIPGFSLPSDVAMPFVDYSGGVPTVGGSAGNQTAPSGPTTVGVSTVSCTGGFMDLFTSGCPDPLTETEILIGVGVLAVVGFMMMNSGSGGRYR